MPRGPTDARLKPHVPISSDNTESTEPTNAAFESPVKPKDENIPATTPNDRKPKDADPATIEGVLNGQTFTDEKKGNERQNAILQHGGTDGTLRKPMDLPDYSNLTVPSTLITEAKKLRSVLSSYTTDDLVKSDRPLYIYSAGSGPYGSHTWTYTAQAPEGVIFSATVPHFYRMKMVESRETTIGLSQYIAPTVFPDAIHADLKNIAPQFEKHFSFGYLAVETRLPGFAMHWDPFEPNSFSLEVDGVDNSVFKNLTGGAISGETDQKVRYTQNGHISNMITTIKLLCAAIRIQGVVLVQTDDKGKEFFTKRYPLAKPTPLERLNNPLPDDDWIYEIVEMHGLMSPSQHVREDIERQMQTTRLELGAIGRHVSDAWDFKWSSGTVMNMDVQAQALISRPIETAMRNKIDLNMLQSLLDSISVPQAHLPQVQGLVRRRTMISANPNRHSLPYVIAPWEATKERAFAYPLGFVISEDVKRSVFDVVRHAIFSALEKSYMDSEGSFDAFMENPNSSSETSTPAYGSMVAELVAFREMTSPDILATYAAMDMFAPFFNLSPPLLESYESTTPMSFLMALFATRFREIMFPVLASYNPHIVNHTRAQLCEAFFPSSNGDFLQRHGEVAEIVQGNRVILYDASTYLGRRDGLGDFSFSYMGGQTIPTRNPETTLMMNTLAYLNNNTARQVRKINESGYRYHSRTYTVPAASQFPGRSRPSALQFITDMNLPELFSLATTYGKQIRRTGAWAMAQQLIHERMRLSFFGLAEVLHHIYYPAIESVSRHPLLFFDHKVATSMDFQNFYGVKDGPVVDAFGRTIETPFSEMKFFVFNGSDLPSTMPSIREMASVARTWAHPDAMYQIGKRILDVDQIKITVPQYAAYYQGLEPDTAIQEYIDVVVAAATNVSIRHLTGQLTLGTLFSDPEIRANVRDWYSSTTFPVESYAKVISALGGVTRDQNKHPVIDAVDDAYSDPRMYKPQVYISSFHSTAVQTPLFPFMDPTPPHVRDTFNHLMHLVFNEDDGLLRPCQHVMASKNGRSAYRFNSAHYLPDTWISFGEGLNVAINSDFMEDITFSASLSSIQTPTAAPLDIGPFRDADELYRYITRDLGETQIVTFIGPDEVFGDDIVRIIKFLYERGLLTVVFNGLHYRVGYSAVPIGSVTASFEYENELFDRLVSRTKAALLEVTLVDTTLDRNGRVVASAVKPILPIDDAPDPLILRDWIKGSRLSSTKYLDLATYFPLPNYVSNAVWRVAGEEAWKTDKYKRALRTHTSVMTNEGYSAMAIKTVIA
ncbi:putative methyltransferase [Sclerotinia sclerotiorum reovirus 1]|nr:putative methyltransferase [Sclerotinia sclerotiorum reovirus 1]